MSTPKGDMLVLGPDSAFQLKLIPLNPSEFTGAGMELSKSSRVLDQIRRSPEFGLRPLFDSDIEKLLRSISTPDGALPHLQSIIKRTPLSPVELARTDTTHLLTGPVLTRPDFHTLSSETKRLQQSLEREAMETFRRRYPMRAGMYF
ncbi:MAG: hypothetical protein JSW61_02670 [Candidatus Thorarchaeota archaeon]|nr:MAG: hypothetical protein JSW61_02670 [Candidatus Thorarchaeota archaeon]